MADGTPKMFSHNYFRKAMREYGILSCVCSDKVGENTMVCYFMVPKGEHGVVVTLPVGLPIIRE